MGTITVKDRDDLLEVLDAFTADGCDLVAICGGSSVDSVQLLACTDPDGEWWWMQDTSGDQWAFSRHERVSEMHIGNPTLVLFPDHHAVALESAGSETGEQQ